MYIRDADNGRTFGLGRHQTERFVRQVSSDRPNCFVRYEHLSARTPDQTSPILASWPKQKSLCTKNIEKNVDRCKTSREKTVQYRKWYCIRIYIANWDTIKWLRSVRYKNKTCMIKKERLVQKLWWWIWTKAKMLHMASFTNLILYKKTWQVWGRNMNKK